MPRSWRWDRSELRHFRSMWHVDRVWDDSSWSLEESIDWLTDWVICVKGISPITRSTTSRRIEKSIWLRYDERVDWIWSAVISNSSFYIPPVTMEKEFFFSARWRLKFRNRWENDFVFSQVILIENVKTCSINAKKVSISIDVNEKVRVRISSKTLVNTWVPRFDVWKEIRSFSQVSFWNLSQI